MTSPYRTTYAVTVLYVIDHQRPGRDYWSKPETSITFVTASGDEAAQEIADRYRLTNVPVVRQGHRIRVRVWPEPGDIWATLAHDPDTATASGTWIHDPRDGAE